MSSRKKRPPGTKLAKHNKAKSKVEEALNTRHINLLETFNKNMVDNQARKMEMEERRVVFLERQTTCEGKKIERKDLEMEEKIMRMGMSAIKDQKMKAYYQHRRALILTKWINSSSQLISSTCLNVNMCICFTT